MIKALTALVEFCIAAELGFKTAVTMRPGVLFKVHRDYHEFRSMANSSNKYI